jgi:phospholipase/lecithinase/hemolysin
MILPPSAFFPRHLASKAAALLLAAASFWPTVATVFGQQIPTFTQIIVFGDSLSDNGNIRHRMESDFMVGYPGGEFNYSDGRFTNSSDTDPASALYAGVWHEQLATTFLSLAVATNSLDGGFDYAFGGATTNDGSSDRTVISNPDPFSGGEFSISIDNLGGQVDEYIGSFTADANALYIVWGGGNDLFDDDSAANVTATVSRVGGLIGRLANAGARNFLVPNVPPLGEIPHYNADSTRAAELDMASASYRSQLTVALNLTKSALAGQGINVQIYPVDIWSLVVRLTAEPSKYGFTNVVDSAQGESVDPDQYLFWDDIHPTAAGHFQIANEANRVLSSVIQPLGKALNISSRVRVGTGENVAIAGFIITGTDPKQVILRAIGPSLSSSGIQGPLSDPTLALYNHAGTLLATNDNWKDMQQAEIEATGIPPTNDLESAIVETLVPGSYTAVLRGKNGAIGIALVEGYDLNPAANSAFGNVSTRGFVGTGEDVIIGGFIVGSGENPIVEVRAIGPSLSSFGIAGPLQDPTLELHDKNGALIAFDDNWKDAQESAIRASGIAPTDDRESAIVVSLAPGNYTAVVRGKNNTMGVALVEAYRIQ